MRFLVSSTSPESRKKTIPTMRRLTFTLLLTLPACSTAPTQPPPGWQPPQRDPGPRGGKLYDPTPSIQSAAPSGPHPQVTPPTTFQPPQRLRFPAYSSGMAYLGGEDGHWLQSNSGNGKILTLEDGSVWKVDAMDSIDSALWLPISNISVVESSSGTLLINTDDEEKVHATLLHQ